MLHSGVEAELLAGQIYQENNAVATTRADLATRRKTLLTIVRSTGGTHASATAVLLD